jgi:hypothetical protein
VPAVKNVLKHVRVEQAKRKRRCGRNPTKHPIKAGEHCLVVQNGQDTPNYCLACAGEILSLAQTILDELKNSLNGVGSVCAHPE